MTLVGRAGRLLGGDAFVAIWPATLLLFAASAILAPGSVGVSAIVGLLPFASILAVAAIGQTLVVQQRGLDLSVAGVISVTTVIVTKFPAGDDGKLPAALGLVVIACVLSGLVSGLAVTRFGITPIVATIGVNALLSGAVLQLTGGASTAGAPPLLDAIAFGKTAGIPNTLIAAVATILLVAGVIRLTVVGRRFVAIGANPLAAHVAGIPIRRYQLGTYVLASLSYGLAGVLLAGFLGTPGLFAGADYLLPTIAAVVLGGTSLAGGGGSVVATAMGALFLTQLQQLVLGMGAPASTQLIVTGLIIALGMGLRNVPWSSLARRGRPPPPPDTAAANASSAGSEGGDR